MFVLLGLVVCVLLLFFWILPSFLSSLVTLVLFQFFNCVLIIYYCMQASICTMSGLVPEWSGPVSLVVRCRMVRCVLTILFDTWG